MVDRRILYFAAALSALALGGAFDALPAPRAQFGGPALDAGIAASVGAGLGVYALRFHGSAWQSFVSALFHDPAGAMCRTGTGGAS